MRIPRIYNNLFHFDCGYQLVISLSIFLISATSIAQCPPNIDFENGTFSGWTCYTGSVSSATGVNVITLTPSGGPIFGRHTMMNALPGNGLDPYGDFPQNCPNGSQHSIKLGNNQGGAQAEGVSYQFTIPATAHKYSLIYHYAVVFQDPGHQVIQQPRLQIEITNVTDNTVIDCSSFSFIASSGLPGFFHSPHQIGPDLTPVWCKDWSANSIKLDGNEGKTIKLFFKTADCTLSAHFGYAYVDVDSDCSGTFVGATYCHDDTAVNVLAPDGYQNYTWFNSLFTQVLGTSQFLHLSPPPPSGTTLAVELTPYNGYGCKDTLYSQLLDTLTLTASAGPDQVSCNGGPVRLGGPQAFGVVYSWSPTLGLDNPNSANPIATPNVSTAYALSVTSLSGGCLAKDTVMVNVVNLDSSILLVGSDRYCTGTGVSSVLKVHPADSIQWFKNNIPIPGANQTQLVVSQSGQYYAKLFSNAGCSATTASRQIDVYSSPVAAFAHNALNQCLDSNQFVLTNNSSIASGAMQFLWDMGDGSTFSTTDITHSYAAPGSYIIKLHVSAAGGCNSDSAISVQVFPIPTSDFSVQPICVNLLVPVINKTVNNTSSTLLYLWDLGNGQSASIRSPIYTYSVPGTYNIKLSVSTTQCPASVSTKLASVLIDAPAAAITYPSVTAVMNYPLNLHARSIGATALWIPATSLDNRNSYMPVFKGPDQQLFQIQLKTLHGCLTVDTLLVKTLKKIAIYVPTGFSPNGDGKNDFLRPTLMGFKTVNYFKVYNRWGQLMYQMKSDKPGWDGRVNSMPQDSQVFIWMIEAEDVDGKIHHEQGTSVLIR